MFTSAAGRPGTSSICSASDISIGKTARLKPVKRIERCAATDVDPDTGIRDLTVPRTLMQNFGHTDCGIYAEVIEAGDIARGDTLSVSASPR